jgi:hypothetical protein
MTGLLAAATTGTEWWGVVGSLFVMVVVTGLLFLGSKKINVATSPGTLPVLNAPGTTRTVRVGDIVHGEELKARDAEKEAAAKAGDAKPEAATAGDNQPEGDVATKEVTISLFRSIVVGADNRLSTSKTVAFVWTYVIAFAMIALGLADLFGDPDGWRKLAKNGLQEEYLIALGGPYAAAVIAKYSAVSASQSSGKPSAAPGDEKAKDLVANDQGGGDLGDFQYVLFNAIAIASVLIAFLRDVGSGLPAIPSVLAGLALTSAGAYSAKKLVSASPPSLTNLLPPTADRNGTVQVWGSNLVLPAVAASESPQMPTIMIGSAPVTITDASASPGGTSRLTVVVPKTLKPGPYIVSAVRDDGLPATGPGGATGLPLHVSTNPALPDPKTDNDKDTTKPEG